MSAPIFPRDFSTADRIDLSEALCTTQPLGAWPRSLTPEANRSNPLLGFAIAIPFGLLCWTALIGLFYAL